MVTVARRMSFAALLVAGALVAHLFMAAYGHAAEPSGHAAHGTQAVPEEAGTAADMLSFCFAIFVAAGVGASLWHQLAATVGKVGDDCDAIPRPAAPLGLPARHRRLISGVDTGVLLRV